MKVKSITIGNTQIKNNLFLAPIAGYTDYSFRHLIIGEGAGLTFTELVSAKGLIYGGNGSKELLFVDDDINNTAAQIFGSEEYFMRAACESEHLAPFDIIDINMGCPVPKVFKNGEGSALLADIKKAEKLVKECAKSGKTITVKIRSGLKEGDDIAADFAKALENAGASAVTIHGRVREMYYSGEVNYNAIYKAKKAVKIPIIANGGVFTEEDADILMDRTGADGVMIARGAIANPFIFNQIQGVSPTKSLKEFMLEHVLLMKEQMGENKAAKEWRKFIPYYFKGMNNVKHIKAVLLALDTASEIVEFLTRNF